MSWLLTALGALLVLVAVRDVFHTLWHPRGFGSIARLVFRLVWWFGHRLARAGRDTELGGPVGLFGAVTTWTVLIVLGWALIYLPQMPEGFYFGSPLTPVRSDDLMTSIYLSLVAVATLGFGDILPATPVLRILAPVQALIGFVLLTAAISWILQVYPALARRRALARLLSSMAETDLAGRIPTAVPDVAVQHLAGVAGQLAAVEVDLMQYAESYYFRETDPRLSLAATLPHVAELVDAGRRSAAPEVRQAAELLDRTAGHLLDRLDRTYLGTEGDASTVVAAFAADHGHRDAATAAAEG